MNCSDEQRLWLTAREIGLAILVRPAPAVPDTVDAAAA